MFTHSEDALNLETIGTNMHLFVQIRNGNYYWLIYVFTKDKLKKYNQTSTRNTK